MKRDAFAARRDRSRRSRCRPGPLLTSSTERAAPSTTMRSSGTAISSASARARSTDTPATTPVVASRRASTGLPRLIDARRRPVGASAKSAPTAGVAGGVAQPAAPSSSDAPPAARRMRRERDGRNGGKGFIVACWMCGGRGLRVVRLARRETGAERVQGRAIARQHLVRRLAVRVGGERLPERRRDAGEGRMAPDQGRRRERELAAAALDLGGLGADVRAEQVEMAMDRREPRLDARAESVLVLFDALGEREELRGASHRQRGDVAEAERARLRLRDGDVRLDDRRGLRAHRRVRRRRTSRAARSRSRSRSRGETSPGDGLRAAPRRARVERAASAAASTARRSSSCRSCADQRRGRPVVPNVASSANSSRCRPMNASASAAE